MLPLCCLILELYSLSVSFHYGFTKKGKSKVEKEERRERGQVLSLDKELSGLLDDDTEKLQAIEKGLSCNPDDETRRDSREDHRQAEVSTRSQRDHLRREDYSRESVSLSSIVF